MKPSRTCLGIAGFVFTLCLSGLPKRAAGAALSFPVTVRGGNERSFTPESPKKRLVRDKARYDVAIVGGGLAGMTAALYLSDHGKKVLLLEKEDGLGGLAFGGVGKDGVPFNRGGAYWTSAYEEEAKILEHIGLGHYKELHAIHEPADSYLWKGRLYLGLWEGETLKELPASFALFHNELKLADKEKLIPNQPFEEQELVLDKMTAAEWIRKMPGQAAARTDEESLKIYSRFKTDTALDPADPMRDVIGLMDVFCRSALGATPDVLSAAAFANFYISEIETRYSSPIGNGETAAILERQLRNRGHLVTIRLKAAVNRIADDGNGVTVNYVSGGAASQAAADYAVFAAQLKFAPRIIEGLEKKDPERAAAIRDIPYSHYAVHVVFVKGHPYRATFDTWTRPEDYRPTDFTDVILGRWMDPAIRGYEGMRDFKADPKDDRGVFTIYHPYLHPGHDGGRAPGMHAQKVARKAVKRMLELYEPLLREKWGTKIEVESVETNRWPYSIHIARPGHFSKVKILRKPLGRVFFANNNLGTPSYEEALFRGHCAANNILKRFNEKFSQEPWSRCPLEP